MRTELAATRRWVVKIGSAMLTAEGRGLDREALADWCGQMAKLHREGRQIAVVSSGAIAVGLQLLGWRTRPKELHRLQSAAAVGQIQLAQAWQEAFAAQGITAAQVLLTHDDAANRRRYLNIRDTLQTLGTEHIVPIINENDTVSFEEIRFGDNDNLGAMVANITQAGGYLILTDQQGLYEENPRHNPKARLVPFAEAQDEALLAMAGREGGALGSGGMYSKILAARRAARSGTDTVLAYGRAPEVIVQIARGVGLGTWLKAPNTPQQARKQWLGAQLQEQGALTLDEGAVRALRAGKSLLPVGVLAVAGDFSRGALVACRSLEGEIVARGLCNYDAEHCRALLGKHSAEAALEHGEEFIHRDNLVLM